MTRESTYENASTEVIAQPERRNAVVRPHAEPIGTDDPQAWGWHGETGKWGRIIGVLTTLIILAYLFGNHRGKVEDLWLVGIAFVMVLILIADWRRRKNAWRAQ